MNKKTAVVLVNWNSFEFTDQCLSSLNKCDNSVFDTIVVDNGSKDSSGDQLKKVHPHIILINSATNLGFAGGNNLGINYALENAYTYVMMLNNDTFVEPDFLDVLIKFMDENPKTGIVQPKIYCNHDRSLLWNGGSYFNKFVTHPYTKGYLSKDKPEYNRIKEVDWVTGCGFFARAEVLKTSGILEEKFFIYYEDVDLSFRIRKDGHQLIYNPNSVIYHIAGMSNKSKTKQKEGFVNPVVHYQIQRNRIWFTKRYVSGIFLIPTILYHSSYSLAVMIYFIGRGRFKKLNALLSGIKEGLTHSL